MSRVPLRSLERKQYTCRTARQHAECLSMRPARGGLQREYLQNRATTRGVLARPLASSGLFCTLLDTLLWITDTRNAFLLTNEGRDLVCGSCPSSVRFHLPETTVRWQLPARGAGRRCPCSLSLSPFDSDRPFLEGLHPETPKSCATAHELGVSARCCGPRCE